MVFRLSIFFSFIAFTATSFSQVNFNIHKQKLKPSFFDTAENNIFVYETPNANIYFKQDDIKIYIDYSNNKNISASNKRSILLDTLNKNIRLIKVIDFYHYYSESQRDSIFRQQSESLEVKKLSEDFYFIGAGLILQGRFMVYSKNDKKFVTKKLIARRVKEYLGQRSLQFSLPSKKMFYYIITTLGE